MLGSPFEGLHVQMFCACMRVDPTADGFGFTIRGVPMRLPVLRDGETTHKLKAFALILRNEDREPHTVAVRIDDQHGRRVGSMEPARLPDVPECCVEIPLPQLALNPFEGSMRLVLLIDDVPVGVAPFRCEPVDRDSIRRVFTSH
jgi:hypothetical protein